jgi:hypothetical protein
MTPSGALTTARSGASTSRPHRAETRSGIRASGDPFAGGEQGRGGLQVADKHLQRRGYAITTKASAVGLTIAQV